MQRHDGLCSRCKSGKAINKGVYCRPCKQEYDRAYAKKTNYRHRKRKAARIKARIVELKNKPCSDCGSVFPHYVMDFDHKENKLFNIADAFRRVGWSKLSAEIEKCDLVCSNCHRIRTHKRRALSLISKTPDFDSGDVGAEPAAPSI